MRRCYQILLIISLILFGASLPSTAKASVDDFYFDSMEVDYYLSKNEQGRSVVKVKEVLMAVFPEYDQNRGIVRAIPTRYQDHSVDLTIDSVLRNGAVANIYSDETEDNYRILTIRDDSDDYLHGSNVYEIDYTMHDVTLNDSGDSQVDEFYWDVNGNGWSQDFGRVVARVHLAEDLQDNLLTNRIACYTGSYGGTDRNCDFDASDGTITISTTEKLLANQTLTLAIGFKSQTFEAYQMSDRQKMLLALTLAISVIAILLILQSMWRLYVINKQQKIKLVPTEYLPPDVDDYIGFSLSSGNYIRSVPLSVGLINLAVNHKIKIFEVKKKGIFGSETKYEFEPINLNSWTDNDQQFYKAVTKKAPVLGQRNKLSETDYAMSDRIGEFNKVVEQQLDLVGLRDEDKTKISSKPILKKSVVAVILAVLSMFLISSLSENGIALQGVDQPILDGGKMFFWVAMILSIIIAVGLMLTASNFSYLTENGLRVVTSMLGLKRYIGLAEKERLEFNQSIGGAMRTAENQVQLYERLLPYAILFGLEKSWAKVLEKVYDENSYQPDWYLGAAAFNAAHFSSAISSFSTAALHASNAGSSSSGGGSGGGGFSGGGGGGGGGGGC